MKTILFLIRWLEGYLFYNRYFSRRGIFSIIRIDNTLFVHKFIGKSEQYSLEDDIVEEILVLCVNPLELSKGRSHFLEVPYKNIKDVLLLLHMSREL